MGGRKFDVNQYCGRYPFQNGMPKLRKINQTFEIHLPQRVVQTNINSLQWSLGDSMQRSFEIIHARASPMISQVSDVYPKPNQSRFVMNILTIKS